MRAAAILASAALAASGCGGDSASEIVGDAAESLDEIVAGELRVELEVTPQGTSPGDPFGFRLSGPFEVPTEPGLPVAELRYSQFASGEDFTATLESGPDGAAITTETGAEIALTEEQTAALETAGRGEGLAALGLDFDEWIEDPEAGDGPSVAGEATERVSGTLDVSAALEDLARAAGGEAQELDERTREGIEDAVERSSIELLVGEDDRALRRVELELDVRGADEIEPLLGLSGASLRLVFEVAEPRLR